MLHRLRAAMLRERGEQHVALVAVHRRRAHLDEFVRGQRALDFREHRVGEALAAEMHHGVEGVRARLEGLPLGR